jgi:N-methylhydantoinase A
MLRIGIDIGGTFTDFVVYDSDVEKLTTFKLLSDSKDPANTVIHGLNIISPFCDAQIIHGSTVATNALLEHKGARTALITTQGFRDILQIGRQIRPNIYDWNQPPSPPLVPDELRFEVTERIDAHGNVLIPLNFQQVREISNHLKNESIESIAICMLFSFLHTNHEQRVASHLRKIGYFVSTSSEILPEYREYERTSTTVVNAYVSPILDRYLLKLQNSLPNTHLQMMQSNGGMINIDEARKNGARCILSGPAGGIVGAEYIASQILASKQLPNQNIKIITFDMGGTSTDVSLVNGSPSQTTNASISGYPIHLPMIDIHTIGTGGGSIAYIDLGGLLRVGPQSSGADPGPACYGKGDLPTVTDANVVLGRILPKLFLGGKMPIYSKKAFTAIANLGKKLNLTPVQTAKGVIDIVNIQMERALRVISVERGHDPHDFSLFSYGGAGGLHATALARNMGIPKVIIPRYSSTLSALGMLVANVMKDYVQTIMFREIKDIHKIEKLFSPLITKAIHDIERQGIPKDHIEVQRSLDIRYIGQSYELNVPFNRNFEEIFFNIHRYTYGYAYKDIPVEIVNIRVKALGKGDPFQLPKFSDMGNGNKPQIAKRIKVELSNGSDTIPMYLFDQLYPGMAFEGPALIVASDTTILVDHRDKISVDEFKNLQIEIYQIDPKSAKGK